MRILLTLLASGLAASAFAQECPRPAPRPLIPLQTAISQDESMAQAFELAAVPCAHEDLACDQARATCSASLTQTLQRQLNFDEGAYLRDLLIAYQGQQYRLAAPIPSASAVTDVSCNADGVTLKSAAARRRVQAERRKKILSEYPRWASWVLQQHQLCQDRLAADRIRVEAQAADAAKLLAAAQAAKLAEEVRLDQARAIERAAAKAKEDALAKQKAVDDAALAQAEDEKKAALERADAEKRARESAEETAARQSKEADHAKIVAEREGRKDSAKQKKSELLEKERARQDEVNLRHAQAQKNAEGAHQKKIDDLRRSLELSEAEKEAQVAEVDRQFEEAETKRRETALKEIEAAGEPDLSDERLIGALTGHGATGYLSIGGLSSPMLGGQITIRQGFWGTAPADGMASGFEIRATALILAALSGPAMLIQVAPEFRYWFGRFALGAAGEFQNLKFAAASSQSTFALGPTFSMAAIDTPDARLLFTVRYLPIVVSGGAHQFERITGEIEGGYAIFSFAAQGGVIKDSSSTPTPPTGWFIGGCVGARLRW